MKGLKRVFKGFLFLLLAGLLTGVSILPLSAQVTIPYGSIIHSAHFYIYQVGEETGQTVWVHPITSEWTELGVTWNSFAGSFNPIPVGSFSTAALGWKTIDLKALVEVWLANPINNYGILLRQGPTSPRTLFLGSEWWNLPFRPKLEISFTPPGGELTQLVIQRPGEAQDGVADAMIWEGAPNNNYGNYNPLQTGLVLGFEKYSLIRFFITVVPPSQGTGTPGYWKNHPEAWPVDSIDIGGIVFSKAEAIAIMNTSPSGDMTYVMFNALVAAILNVEVGNDPSCIAATITAAQNWMWQNPLGSGVAGRSEAWKIGEPLYKMLDDYNNGLLCAPSRDSLEY